MQYSNMWDIIEQSETGAQTFSTTNEYYISPKRSYIGLNGVPDTNLFKTSINVVSSAEGDMRCMCNSTLHRIGMPCTHFPLRSGLDGCWMSFRPRVFIGFHQLDMCLDCIWP